MPFDWITTKSVEPLRVHLSEVLEYPYWNEHDRYSTHDGYEVRTQNARTSISKSGGVSFTSSPVMKYSRFRTEQREKHFRLYVKDMVMPYPSQI